MGDNGRGNGAEFFGGMLCLGAIIFAVSGETGQIGIAGFVGAVGLVIHLLGRCRQ